MSVSLFFIDFHAVAPQSTRFGTMAENFPAELLSTSKPHFLRVGLNIISEFWNPEKKKFLCLLLEKNSSLGTATF
jgi:hypothetical protein